MLHCLFKASYYLFYSALILQAQKRWSPCQFRIFIFYSRPVIHHDSDRSDAAGVPCAAQLLPAAAHKSVKHRQLIYHTISKHLQSDTKFTILKH